MTQFSEQYCFIIVFTVHSTVHYDKDIVMTCYRALIHVQCTVNSGQLLPYVLHCAYKLINNNILREKKQDIHVSLVTSMTFYNR